MGLSIEEQKAVERFRQQVVEPSRDKLVIVDFWAEWCGPCKALAPVLEKVCAEHADKGVVLVKINVDEEGFIAQQFQVQSIPAVYGMFQGQPVADLTPARSESQLRAALDQILRQLPVKPGAGGGEQGVDLLQLVAMGDEVLAGGDAARAVSIFGQIVEMAPEQAAAQAGLIKALLADGQADAAQAAMEAVPEAIRAYPLLAQTALALKLAGSRVDQTELAALRERAAADPADMAAQLAYARAAFADGQRDDAARLLLDAIARDPTWNEGAAKAELLRFFEAVGLEDAWVASQRRKLSLLLFG